MGSVPDVQTGGEPGIELPTFRLVAALPPVATATAQTLYHWVKRPQACCLDVSSHEIF